MKNFDRILNIVLGIAVALFIADYFLSDNPASFDEGKNSKFAPVELGRAVTEETTQSPELTAEEDAAIGGPEVIAPEAFRPLSWEQLDAKINDSNGKPTLIVLFTSWCPFCKKMMPIVSASSFCRMDTTK
jgi:thiol-disulfide isomerase/thioredoxin